MKKIIIGMMFLLLAGGFAVALEQKVVVTIIPGRLNVFSPIEGEIYDSRMIELNVSMDGKVEKFRYGYVDNGGHLVTLCRSCDEYGFSKLKRKPFDEGFHELTLLAIFETGSVGRTINFTIDTKSPKIKRVFPQGGIGGGNFEIFFQEVNPEEVTLHYGESNHEVDIGQNCFSDDELNYVCSFDVDLSNYDGQEIEYWFEVVDIINHREESKSYVLSVDTNPPIITNADSFLSIDGRRIHFNIGVDEENFDRVVFSYVDEKGIEHDGRLCSRLRDGFCERVRPLRKGNYNLEIKVFDEAGNSATENAVFEIV